MGSKGLEGPGVESESSSGNPGQWGGRATKMGQERVGERAGRVLGRGSGHLAERTHHTSRKGIDRFRSDTGPGISCRESGRAGTAEWPPPSATLLRVPASLRSQNRTGQSITQVPRDWLCPPVFWASQLLLQLMVAFSQEGISQGVVRVSWSVTGCL